MPVWCVYLCIYALGTLREADAGAKTNMLRNAQDMRALLWVAAYFVCLRWCWSDNEIRRGTCAPRVALMAYSSFACACITHNAMHARVFVQRAHEQVLRLVLSVAYGHPVSTFIPGHNLSHHRHTQSRKDPMRTSKVRYRWHVLNVLLFQLAVTRDVFRMDMRFLNMQRRGSAHDRACFVRTCLEWCVVVMSNLGLGLLDWRRFLLYVYIPHIAAQWGIVTMNMLQHDGCDAHTPPAAVGFNTSRNFTGGLLNFLTFNNGFHTAHHLHPSMHWSLLPASHATIAHKIHPALNQTCMASYVFTTFVYPGVRVDYLGKQVEVPSADTDTDEDWTVHHAREDTRPGSDCSDYLALLGRYVFSCEM